MQLQVAAWDRGDSADPSLLIARVRQFVGQLPPGTAGGSRDIGLDAFRPPWSPEPVALRLWRGTLSLAGYLFLPSLYCWAFWIWFTPAGNYMVRFGGRGGQLREPSAFENFIAKGSFYLFPCLVVLLFAVVAYSVAIYFKEVGTLAGRLKSGVAFLYYVLLAAWVVVLCMRIS